MSRFSVRIPDGFAVAKGDLNFMDATPLSSGPDEVSAIYQGEDLLIVEHLMLDASVHLDARRGAFVVTLYTGENGEEHTSRMSARLGDALDDFDRLVRSIWDLGLPLRASDAVFGLDEDEGSLRQAHATWIVPAGWVVFTDRLGDWEAPPPVGSQPTSLVFAAASGHRSIAIYHLSLVHREDASFAAFLWADPPSSLYERVFLRDFGAVVAWLRRRIDHEKRLPKRRNRP